MMRKTYVAPTMAQALAQVKSDLGRDAVILYARNVRKNGLLGLLGGKCLWEVTAVPHAESPTRMTATGLYIGGESASRGGKGAVAVASRGAGGAGRLTRRAALGDEDIHTILTGTAAVRRTAVAAGASNSTLTRDAFTGGGPAITRDELNVLALKPGLDVPADPAAKPASKPTSSSATSSRTDAPPSVVVKGGPRLAIAAPALAPPPEPPTAAKPVSTAPAVLTPAVFAPTIKPWPRELANFHAHLLRQDVEERIADDLIHELALSMSGANGPVKNDAAALAARLGDLIAARIPTAGPAPRKPSRNGPRVIALAGPTGVGKTTTIAKLAADFKLRQRKRVGLVTMDTYRIAAVDQLRVYAEIIEVPLRTVLSAGEMHQAVYGMDVDVVLIDSAGRSQNDQPRLNELRAFLTAADADEVHLVVSATASRRTLLTMLNRFATMAPNRLILTKLDEAETFGTILSFPTIGAAPLAYTTMGQDVPDDIEPADPWQLAQRVLRGVS